MKDKVVVITGASSGIGAELARIVGERGGKPVLAARREDVLREVAATAGPDALVVPTDVTKRDDVAGLVRAALDRFGRIDVWVNNAGRGISKPVSQVTDDDFDTMMLVNTKSALYGMQEVLPHFKERGTGHIINVSSLLGRVPVAHVRSAYNAAKHALNALTGSLRIELHQDYPGIRVSTVSPGVVATEFGVRALGGGMDSRQMPNAQPVTEVAEVIADVIENPRADVYSRPMYKDLIAGYFAAEDMAEVERRPPFVPPVGK
ncbi:MAG: SDR family NAD(P)-dependent oxidoreductase [Candidatus Eisenbacteria bacterium]